MYKLSGQEQRKISGPYITSGVIALDQKLGGRLIEDIGSGLEKLVNIGAKVNDVLHTPVTQILDDVYDSLRLNVYFSKKKRAKEKQKKEAERQQKRSAREARMKGGGNSKYAKKKKGKGNNSSRTEPDTPREYGFPSRGPHYDPGVTQVDAKYDTSTPEGLALWVSAQGSDKRSKRDIKAERKKARGKAISERRARDRQFDEGSGEEPLTWNDLEEDRGPVQEHNHRNPGPKPAWMKGRDRGGFSGQTWSSGSPEAEETIRRIQHEGRNNKKKKPKKDPSTDRGPGRGFTKVVGRSTTPSHSIDPEPRPYHGQSPAGMGHTDSFDFITRETPEPEAPVSKVEVPDDLSGLSLRELYPLHDELQGSGRFDFDRVRDAVWEYEDRIRVDGVSYFDLDFDFSLDELEKKLERSDLNDNQKAAIERILGKL